MVLEPIFKAQESEILASPLHPPSHFGGRRWLSTRISGDFIITKERKSKIQRERAQGIDEKRLPHQLGLTKEARRVVVQGHLFEGAGIWVTFCDGTLLYKSPICVPFWERKTSSFSSGVSLISCFLSYLLL